MRDPVTTGHDASRKPTRRDGMKAPTGPPGNTRPPTPAIARSDGTIQHDRTDSSRPGARQWNEPARPDRQKRRRPGPSEHARWRTGPPARCTSARPRGGDRCRVGGSGWRGRQDDRSTRPGERRHDGVRVSEKTCAPSTSARPSAKRDRATADRADRDWLERQVPDRSHHPSSRRDERHRFDHEERC